MKKGTLVPTINAMPVNPNIKLEHTAFYLQEQTEPWHRLNDPETGKQLPRRSMINSFGAGGAYANLIIEEYMETAPEKEHIAPRQQEFTAVFSAKTKWSLLSYLENMQLFLEKEASLDIEPVVQALHRRNHNLEHRTAFTVASTQELIEKLKVFRTSRESSLQQGIYTSFDLQPCAESASRDREINAAEQWAQGALIAFKEADIGNRTGWVHLPHYAFDHNTSFHFDVSSINEKSSDVEDNINQPVIQDQFTYDEPYVQGHVFNKIGRAHV